MTNKLLVGGVVLTLLAIGSERRLVLAHDEVPVTREVAASDPPSITDRVVSSVSDAFDGVVADAVAKGVNNAEQVLQMYQPRLPALRGEEGENTRQLATEIADACKHAREELKQGRTFVALDYAMQASRDLDELKKVFERR